MSRFDIPVCLDNMLAGGPWVPQIGERGFRQNRMQLIPNGFQGAISLGKGCFAGYVENNIVKLTGFRKGRPEVVVVVFRYAAEPPHT